MYLKFEIWNLINDVIDNYVVDCDVILKKILM